MMRITNIILLVASIGSNFGASQALAGTTEYQMQYKAASGQISYVSVTPDKVRIISRKENMSAVCVETAALGKVWAVPALWMVSASGGEVRQSYHNGQVAGGGNGFGSIREIPPSTTCE